MAAWLAQLGERVTLDLGVLSSGPTLGVEFTCHLAGSGQE